MSGRNSGGRLFRCAPHVGEMSYSFDPQTVEQAGCPEAALEELEGFAACSALDTARKFRTCNKSSSVNCFAFDFNLARFFSWFFSSLATRVSPLSTPSVPLSASLFLRGAGCAVAQQVRLRRLFQAPSSRQVAHPATGRQGSHYWPRRRCHRNWLGWTWWRWQ